MTERQPPVDALGEPIDFEQLVRVATRLLGNTRRFLDWIGPPTTAEQRQRHETILADAVNRLEQAKAYAAEYAVEQEAGRDDPHDAAEARCHDSYKK
jgi:hypothetical protein